MYLLNSVQIDHQQNSLLKFADWVLTPCRKTFHGKTISLITHSNDGDSKVSASATFPKICENKETPRGFKRFLWAALAVSTVAFAALAMLVKLIIRPTLKETLSIGTPDEPRQNVNKVVEVMKEIRNNKIKGKIVGYCSVPFSKVHLEDKELHTALRSEYGKSMKGVISSSAVRKVPKTNSEDSVRLFILESN